MRSLIILAIGILLFSSIAAAAPIPNSPSLGLQVRVKTPQPDDPNETPVDILDLAPFATMTCGSHTFTNDDISKTVRWATNLKKNGVFRGKKSGLFPNGRYPHSYTKTEYTFNGNCPADDNRETHPLIFDGPYNGGKRNTEWGDHRVVFYTKDLEGVDSPEGNPLVYFCGGLTHEGAESPGKFLQCTVN